MAQAIAEYVHPTKAVRVLRPKTFPTPALFVADIVTSFSWISFVIHQTGLCYTSVRSPPIMGSYVTVPH
jgi:hypothetical protein